MHIRPATRADSADLAILDDVASHGLTTRVLQIAVEAGVAERPMQGARDGFAFIDGPFSWRNALVAEIDGVAAGSLLSYPIEAEREGGDPPDAVLVPLSELKAIAEGTRFIDGLAVYPRFRGQGVGRALLQTEIARADRALSLITEDNNARALALYASAGFIEAGRRPFVPFAENQTARQWVLLIRDRTP